jgi:c-di-GMP-binding flagellar brake protein YcgR
MADYDTEQIIAFLPYMASILKRVQVERAMVCVRIGKHPTTYNSIILEVDPQHAQFVLDELNPRSGHDKLRVGSQLHIDARLKGVRVMFTTEIGAITESDGIAMYELSLPATMIYRQRRRHHRALIDQKQPVAISLPLPLKNQIRGELVDISASGVCSRIKYVDSTRLETELAIHDATIALPGQNQITCDLEVRSIRHFPEQGYSLVGSEFIDIPPATQSHVARVVAMLDRHQRRAVHF